MPELPINAVYFPSWRIYKGKTPSSLQPDAITHVLYAFVRVNEDGTLQLLDEWGDLQKEVDGETGCLAAMAKFKRENPHIKTLVSLGGGSGSAPFPALASDPDTRATFAQQCREFVDKYEFDGIDVDWEHPTTPEHGSDYLSLLQASREALPAPDYLITSALPVGEYCLKNIDLPAAAEVLDFLNLMAYDFAGGWTEVSGHQAQLLPHSDDAPACIRKCCASGVDYLLSRGFPSDKIVLGIPAYARFFPGASGPGEQFSDSGEIDYCDLSDDCVNNAVVDEGATAATYVDESDGKGFISFDVPSTVAAKARFAKDKGLAGLFYWTGAGDRGGDQSLVAAGFAELTS